jgi:hypothetical protein
MVGADQLESVHGVAVPAQTREDERVGHDDEKDAQGEVESPRPSLLTGRSRRHTEPVARDLPNPASGATGGLCPAGRAQELDPGILAASSRSSVSPTLTEGGAYAGLLHLHRQ